MRLTLRTLLAYLDDILEPAQAKEIGNKLGESGLASSLASRIREVMRRRRLTAPSLSGPGVGIDPNTIAAYLDNTLPPDGVADVEKICLESDVHLAEAAACHQILTLALGEPVDVPQKTRERMYALGPSGTKMGVTPQRVGTNELPGEALNQVLGQAESLGGGRAQSQATGEKPHVPEYLRTKSSWKKVAASVAVIFLIGLWGFSILQKSPFRLGREVAGPESSADPTRDAAPRRGARPESGSPPSHQTEPAVGESPAGSVASRVAPPPPRTRRPADTQETASINLPLPPDAPDDVEQRYERKADSATTGAADPFAAPAAAAETPTEAPATETRATPVVVPVIPGKYASSEGIALHYVRHEGGWFVLPRRALVHPGDLLAVPDPFEGIFEAEDGAAVVALPGPTTIEWLGPGEAGPVGIALRRGRVVVRTASPGGEQAKALKVGMVLGEALWRFEIAPGTTCGIDLLPRETSKFEQPPAADGYAGGIFVSVGEAAVTDPAGKTTYLHAPAWLKLPTAAVADKLLAIPQWLNRQFLTGLWEQRARLFEKKFKLDEPVDLSLSAVAEDPNMQWSKLATDALGLIDAYRPLVNVLMRTNHDESRQAAISALRQWLPRAEENRELLNAELAKLCTPEDAALVYRLLWGFDADALRDKDVSLQILDWMEHPEVYVRELAFYDVSRLTQKTHEYRPSTKQPLRIQSAVNSWRQYVNKVGALLPPPQKAPAE